MCFVETDKRDNGVDCRILKSGVKEKCFFFIPDFSC